MAGDKGREEPLEAPAGRGEGVLKSHPRFIDMLKIPHSTVEEDSPLKARRKEIYACVAGAVRGDLDEATGEGLIPDTGVDIRYLPAGLSPLTSY